MQDFVRIGGEITSNPLNENFRRLIGEISRANVNLKFSSSNGIVNTIADMNNIHDPEDAQCCYVISSGEFYRYSKGDNQWHKIMDIGQTFRQGFLNSGVVVMEGGLKLKEGSLNTLIIPNMLVYYKNQAGDERYLKGMYLIEEKEFNASSVVTSPGAYSILVKSSGECSITTGMPQTDDPNQVYLGSFLASEGGKILKDFIFTLPDIAYTADRSGFIFDGGQAEGLYLDKTDAGDNTVSRKAGFYYDEGANYPVGQTDNYPVDTDNGSNYNLKSFTAIESVDRLYYTTPTNGLTNGFTEKVGLDPTHYYSNGSLEDVADGLWTIQRHLVTPNGQNIILYGTKTYNSQMDAVTALNDIENSDLNFPFAEVTRIVLQNSADFSTKNTDKCVFKTLQRLAQTGTIYPHFADNIFTIYSGDAADSTPATMRFNLGELQKEDYSNLYSLTVLPSKGNYEEFFSNQKYITDNNVITVPQSVAYTRNGYKIADKEDLDYVKNRINEIEKELWNVYDKDSKRYEQSVRYRLYQLEEKTDEHTATLADHETRLTSVENNKVNKTTKINGYTLGDTVGKNEAKSIALVTGDIAEGQGKGSKVNLWYTEERVNANTNVKKGAKHTDIKSLDDNANTHTKVNPHNLSTDDLNILADTTKIFVTPEEERRIRADRLPENTIQALADLDAKNLDSIDISYMTGNSTAPGDGPIHLGSAKKIRFFKDGLNISMDSDNETLSLECVGQLNDDLMTKQRYATLEKEYPTLYGGYVDKAVNAEFAYNVAGIETAEANQYYGTNDDAEVGIYDLPTYVGTANLESFASVDQIIFTPVDGSITEKHLSTALKDKINNNYHTIYNAGTLKSNKINTLDFGNNLTVTVNGNKATINATGGSGAGATTFATLSDVDVTYTGNEGKQIVINDAGTGLTVAPINSTKDYMLKAVYVDPTDVSRVKKAALADTATIAINANNALALNNKVVDDNATNASSLWTASKIISNTSIQIKNEGVNTYSGKTTPADSLGKNGDIYILTE